MKMLLLSLCLLLLSLSIMAEIIQQPLQRVKPEDFIIMPWGNIWLEQTDDDVIFSEIYDCGFNVTPMITASKVKYAKKYHLGAICQDYSLLDNNIKDYAKRAKNHTDRLKASIDPKDMDALFQVYVQDEPKAEKDTLDRLSAFSKTIRKELNCEPYINLLPNYASAEQLGKEDYNDYLDYFAVGCSLKNLSYDNYSFAEGKGLNEDMFYSNLELVSKNAKKHNIGFVNTIQSVAALYWPVPNDYMIHIQAWSSLAYGAKGISYFTLYTPNMANWRMAPYGMFGEKTPTWNYVRNMNYEIHNISPTYTKLKNINVYHVGNVPKECNDASSAKLIKELNVIYTGNGTPNYLVGEFQDKDGKPYAIIVNKDPVYSILIDKIDFGTGTQIMRAEDRSFGSPIKPYTGEDRYIAPGYGVLLFAE